jgi:hypothetical protein
MKRMFLFLLVIALIFLSNVVYGTIPRLINYQGNLMGADEQPVPEGEYELTFTLYDTSGVQLWSETHNTVFIANGFFHVILGEINPLGIAFDEPYCLGIKVGNDPELQPRMWLTSTPYAIRAEDADKLLGIGMSLTPQPNKFLPLDGNSQFPASVIPGGSGIVGNYIKKNTPDTSRTTSTNPILLVSNLGNGDGINGRSVDGKGIVGRSDNEHGIVGWTGSGSMSGVKGHSTSGMGVEGRSDSHHGVYGNTDSENANSAGVYGNNNGTGPGVWGNGVSLGVNGFSTSGIGVKGSSSHNDGIKGITSASSKSGVFGTSQNGIGVTGWSDGNNGVYAVTTSTNVSHAAIYARNDGEGPGVYAECGSDGTSAIFKGNVKVRSSTTGNLIIELGEGLDYAEGFEVTNAAEINPGSVLVIDPDKPGHLTLSQKSYDNKVAGIAAGARGLGSGVRLGVDQFDCDVALAGRVYCNVDATYGAVVPGDLLTTSPTSGYAMIVKDHAKAQGAILGKAMEALALGEKGQILVLVTLQ